jgi:hypothetical protein
MDTILGRKAWKARKGSGVGLFALLALFPHRIRRGFMP